jgi:hypothetical protein
MMCLHTFAQVIKCSQAHSSKAVGAGVGLLEAASVHTATKARLGQVLGGQLRRLHHKLQALTLCRAIQVDYYLLPA